MTEPMTTKERQALFLELASKPSGVTAQEAFEVGGARGDNVTIEAYHNLGRRLAHRGLLVVEKKDRQTRFFAGAKVDGQWLDEEHLASIVDPDYPLIALTVMKESFRQLQNIPEEIWIAAREGLKKEKARPAFATAIMGYADNLKDELENYKLESLRPESISELPKLRREIDVTILLLKQLAKYGLGLSEEAIHVPANVDLGLQELAEDPDMSFYNKKHLRDEIDRRVADETLIVDITEIDAKQGLLVAAVDGSSRGGLLFFETEGGDLSVGSTPMVSINTAVAQINRSVVYNGNNYPAFLRLPEKPEDMQRQDNRYTVMAKLFFPDLSDTQYAHSVWNAMDVLEARATDRVMGRWYTSKGDLEIQPADVVIRDGSVVPQDRDSNHYKQQDSYGAVVRDLMESNWGIVKKCKDDGQTVAGVVKNAQVSVLSPVLNYFMCQLTASEGGEQFDAWPLRVMNLLPDQVILTRLLTSGRKAGDTWTRSCLIRRPFHAATDFATRYSRNNPAAAIMLKRAHQARTNPPDDMPKEEVFFWQKFRDEKDFYVQMLNNVWYGSFYLGAVPRLDTGKMLARNEFIIPDSTEEKGDFPADVTAPHLNNLLKAIEDMGFDVSDEHAMFSSETKIDVLPALLIRAHDTVKIWATELLSRVQEYIGFHLSRLIKSTDAKGVKIRQWKRAELEAWARHLKRERNEQAGMLEKDDPMLLADSEENDRE
jgi:hypothetical protein